MTKLTTERLEEIAKLEITEFSNGMDIAKDAYQSVGSSEIVLMARQLLAYEQAAEHPIGSFHISGGQVEATTDYCRDGEWPVQDGEVLVYAVPVLPKQPELIGMKVSIDTGSDNIGHRLFGEIVGTSESNGVPVLCIEVTENNVDVAAPAQPVIPEGLIKAINRLLDNDGSRGKFSAVQSYDAREDLERLLAPIAQQNEPQNIPENIPEQPVSELRARAISLYKPPFKFYFGYIWDADGQMVADQNLNEDGQILRVRGWGRISYLENPEALQDEVGEVIALALSNYWNLHIAADLIQPVSEPYKLEIDMDDADHFSITHLHEIIYGKELIWPEAKLLARFMLDVKQRVSAAPAQESE